MTPASVLVAVAGGLLYRFTLRSAALVRVGPLWWHVVFIAAPLGNVAAAALALDVDARAGVRAVGFVLQLACLAAAVAVLRAVGRRLDP